MQCDLCPRAWKLREGQRGLCFVRGREKDEVVLATYGRSSGFCVDPIEKKPLNHFLPGSSVLSFGTAGCNLSCRFCQNWDFPTERLNQAVGPLFLPELSTERTSGVARVLFVAFERAGGDVPVVPVPLHEPPVLELELERPPARPG